MKLLEKMAVEAGLEYESRYQHGCADAHVIKLGFELGFKAARERATRYAWAFVYATKKQYVDSQSLAGSMVENLEKLGEEEV